MARYAFIDVQNTDSTTKQLLGFRIEWIRLYNFLKEIKKCDKIFFYTGIDEKDIEMLGLLDTLEKTGCEMRSKILYIYKNKDKDIKIACPKCGNQFIEHIDMGYNHKSNCDVDLTVDAMQLLGENNIFYFFTGDGDFEYLITTAIKNKTRVILVSNTRKIKIGPRYFTSRFSTKLRKLISDYPNVVGFENINNYRFKIEKID
jgi:uncharacterized LabA/DUF88 family protein